MESTAGWPTPGNSWSVRAEHYFYPGGTLAFRFESLTSYEGHDPEIPDSPSGPFVVETRTYFDEAGKRVRELKKAMFEPTGKRIPVSAVAEHHAMLLSSTRALEGAK